LVTVTLGGRRIHARVASSFPVVFNLEPHFFRVSRLFYLNVRRPGLSAAFGPVSICALIASVGNFCSIRTTSTPVGKWGRELSYIKVLVNEILLCYSNK
jgi:hypothetical protein